MKKVLVSILLISAVLMAQSPMDIAREKIDKAYNHNSDAEMRESRAMFERLLNSDADKWLVNYYIAYCDYRLQTFAMQKEDTKQIKLYIKDGIAKINACLDEKDDFGDAYALLASFYGNKIALNPMSGMWNGMKSGNAMNQAMQYGKTSPRVFLLNGVSTYYTPVKYGGGVEKAVDLLNKAIGLYEQQPADAVPAWGHTDAYTWLGIIEKDRGNTAKAKELFEKALEIEPENGWVKNVLLPEIMG